MKYEKYANTIIFYLLYIGVLIFLFKKKKKSLDLCTVFYPT